MFTRRLASLLLAPLALAMASCIVEADNSYDEPYYDEPLPAPPVSPATVGIATGQTLDSEGGQGAGVLVEYWGEGQWYVRTVCDTFVTGLVCSYDLTLALEANARFVALENDQASDGSNASAFDSAQISLAFDTQTEVDGAVVRVEPAGAPLFVRATIDGELASEYFFWIDEQGTIRHGSPSNPLWFAPTLP